MHKMNKTEKVLEHLKRYGTITSLEAIKLYNATRLSDIIFRLRKRGFKIDTVDVEFIDSFGTKSIYGKYILLDNWGDKMKLYFKNSRGERRIIAEPNTEEEAIKEINKFCNDRNFEVYYIRTWERQETKVYDVGSHTEFFYLVR